MLEMARRLGKAGIERGKRKELWGSSYVALIKLIYANYLINLYGHKVTRSLVTRLTFADFYARAHSLVRSNPWDSLQCNSILHVCGVVDRQTEKQQKVQEMEKKKISERQVLMKNLLIAAWLNLLENSTFMFFSAHLHTSLSSSCVEKCLKIADCSDTSRAHDAKSS